MSEIGKIPPDQQVHTKPSDRLGIKWTQSMYPLASLRLRAAIIPLAALGFVSALAGQPVPPKASPAAPIRLDWRRIGNTALAGELPSPAGGPVTRVWYGTDGARLFVRTARGAVYSTLDFERWSLATGQDAVPPSEADPPVPTTLRKPEPDVKVRASQALPSRVYAAGDYLYRSDNGGRDWNNLTMLGGESLLGGRIADVAVSPVNPDDAVAVNRFGVWVTHDAGLSWSGANEGLPNLPASRILGSPGNRQGVRILVDNGGGEPSVFEWQPGQKFAWLPALPQNLDGDLAPGVEEALRESLSVELKASITAVGASGDSLYAGASDGRIFVSTDSGDTWLVNPPAEGSGAVSRFFIDSADPRVALATFSAGSASNRTPEVVRTLNGGIFWDDITANLPAADAWGITADHDSGAVYVAAASGVYFTMTNLLAPAPATDWQKLTGGLPDAPALDAKLDQNGNQLYVVMDGYGVFATMAPHRMLRPALVHASDLQSGPVAPGDLLSL